MKSLEDCVDVEGVQRVKGDESVFVRVIVPVFYAQTGLACRISRVAIGGTVSRRRIAAGPRI